ncbi:MAG: ATP-binding cassette domain-containing protein [Myxococcales bacterium]|nr:ATP-binding cassette domain-containing protein [Myxococcales bacterium]
MTPPVDKPRNGGDLLRVLELLAEQTGTSFDPQRAWSALVGASRGAASEDAWVGLLVRAAAACGLRVQPTRLTVDEVRGRVGPETPALALLGPTPDSGRWLLVTGFTRRGATGVIVDRGDERSVRLRERPLLRALGLLERDAPALWLLVEPELPFDALHERRLAAVGYEQRALARLRALMRLERSELWVVIVYAVAVGALTLATPIAVQALVNTVAFGALTQPLFVLTMLLMAGLSFAAALKALAAFVVEVLQQRLFVRAVADVARRLPRVDLGRHPADDGPELVNRFFDVVLVQKAAAALLLDGVSVALQAAVGMALLAFYHPLLLAFDILLLLALAALIMLPLRAALGSSLKESASKYETVAWLEEVARNPALFKSESAMQHAVARAEVLSRRYLIARRAHWSKLLRQLVGGLAMQVIAGGALLGVGGLLVLERQLTLGQLVAAELVVTAVSASFGKLGKHIEAFYDLAAGVDKLGKLVDLPLEDAGGVREFGVGAARVRLRGVRLGLGERAALTDLDCEIMAGEHVLVDGDGGSGKSALFDLCFGLRAPDRGQVEVDGVDLRTADLPALREQVALVRTGDLFRGSIRDNLQVGAPDASLAVLRVALSLVALDDTVAALPGGLDTELTPSGSPLSESQASRLVLARALVAQPRLLLIDGALDRLKLPRRKLEALLDHLFATDAAWTLVVASDDPDVRARCKRVVDLARTPQRPEEPR